MDLLAFQNLPVTEVADLVREHEVDVCGFALNGTRRWYILEHQLEGEDDDPAAYFDSISERLIELCRMVYDHGISTLVMPIISPHLLDKRGAAYTQMVIQSLGKLTFGENYRRFYDSYDVRVRFYGDDHNFGQAAVNEQLTQQFADVTAATAGHQSNRLFWGVCAHDATNQIANLSVQYFQKHGVVPVKEQLIELYYGEEVAPVDLFISASKPRAFDTPLISNGREELYFTVAPSPYLNQNAFRKILHDHLFNRNATHATYQVENPEKWHNLRDFYRANQENTLGVGIHHVDWGIWLPTSQIQPPIATTHELYFEDEKHEFN